MATRGFSPAQLRSKIRPLEQAEAWVIEGLVAGCAGAAVVALFFLFWDLSLGRPLWTPAALGSALFLGRAPGPNETANLAVVAAYSAAHGALFLIFGLGAAFAVFDLGMRRIAKGALAVLLAGTLFTAITIAFLLFAALFGSAIAAELGTAKVAAANLIAAGTMAALLARGRRPGGTALP